MTRAAGGPGEAFEHQIEIERKYLLSGMPELPIVAERWRIEQGYLPDGEEIAAQGRLRRAVRRDGSVSLTHTIKRGSGLAREESERTVEEAEFTRLWASTLGRTLLKTRFVVPQDDLTWVIDRFDDRDLVLAEVEIPTAGTPIAVPPWLAAVLVREVTEEPAYRNYALAVRGPADR